MKNEVVNSLVIQGNKQINELNSNRYTAPLIVEGGALFKNGIKLGFCNSDEPIEGSICSNNNKLFFFTNNRWNNINFNGLCEVSTIILNKDITINLDFNESNNFYIKNFGLLDNYCLKLILNKNINSTYMQKVNILIDNSNNDKKAIINIDTNKLLFSKDKSNNDSTIIINSNTINMIDILVYNDIIII